MNSNKKVKQIVIVLLVITIVIVAFTFYTKSKFRIVSSSLSNNVLPTSTSEVIYTFNRTLSPLDKQSDGFLSLSDGINYEVAIEDNKLRIIISTVLEKDREVVVKLSSIVSEKSETIDADFDYRVAYVPFSKLTREEQQRQIDESSVSSDNHPLLVLLPYDEITFRVEAIVDEKNFGKERDWRKEKDNYAIVINTYALKDGVNESVYREKTLALRQEALKWVEKTGVNTNTDINIIYDPSDQKLNGKDIDTGD